MVKIPTIAAKKNAINKIRKRYLGPVKNPMRIASLISPTPRAVFRKSNLPVMAQKIIKAAPVAIPNTDSFK